MFTFLAFSLFGKKFEGTWRGTQYMYMHSMNPKMRSAKKFDTKKRSKKEPEMSITMHSCTKVDHMYMYPHKIREALETGKFIELVSDCISSGSNQFFLLLNVIYQHQIQSCPFQQLFSALPAALWVTLHCTTLFSGRAGADMHGLRPCLTPPLSLFPPFHFYIVSRGPPPGHKNYAIAEFFSSTYVNTCVPLRTMWLYIMIQVTRVLILQDQLVQL